MLVAPPEALKTSFLTILDRYSNAIQVSDINVKTLSAMRSDISSGHIRTLVLPEMRKIYERNPQTASNLEGQIRALVDEGFRAASFEDQRMNVLPARCAVMGAMTEDLFRDKFDHWQKTGFTRRFLWCLYRLSDPQALIRAVEKWAKIDFGEMEEVGMIEVPPAQTIPMQVSETEKKVLTAMIKFQPGGKAIALQLLIKIFCVLRWHNKRTKSMQEPEEIIKQFGNMLSKEGALVTL